MPLFGDDDNAGESTGVAIGKLVEPFDPTESVFGIDYELKVEVESLIEEGVKVLEHAGLLVQRFSGGDTSPLWYRPTRVGTAAVQAGNVRELITG